VLGDVHDRADVLDLTRRIARGVRDDLDCLTKPSGITRRYSSSKSCFSALRARPPASQGRVLRMDTLENSFDGRLRGPVVLEDAKGFLRQTISRVEMFQPKLPV